MQVDELSIIQEEEKIFRIQLKTPDSGRLIGPNGKNVSAISHILKLMFGKHLEHSITLHLEINDYTQQKEKQFFEFIESKIQYVRSSGKECKLPYMSSYERKKVHCFILDGDNKDIFTQSIGE